MSRLDIEHRKAWASVCREAQIARRNLTDMYIEAEEAMWLYGHPLPKDNPYFWFNADPDTVHGFIMESPRVTTATYNEKAIFSRLHMDLSDYDSHAVQHGAIGVLLDHRSTRFWYMLDPSWLYLTWDEIQTQEAYRLGEKNLNVKRP